MASVDHVDMRWWLLFLGVTALSFGTRLYKLDEPDHVCWDETHFGKMGSWYINRTFFFDVHPPLGKMLIGLAGHLTGYDGSFAFSKPGDEYGETEYVGMRLICATFGASLVPLCFCIAWELSKSYGAASLTGIIIIFDTGVLTLSQYILLDPILIFFIMTATLCLIKFRSQDSTPFSLRWWLMLSLTGLFLACSIGVKFVGLFVILLAGVTVAWDLWQLMGDMQLSMVDVFKHFLARALCLIVLPTVTYMVLFFIHFQVLNRSGDGDGFFSSSFQSQLLGNPLHNATMPQQVAFGSVVTLKNHRTAGAYLHSHWHLYPEGVGAKQQQVTTYSHKDDNNKWMIKQADSEPQETDTVEYLRNGDLVRLEHVSTRRNLHAHQEPAPLTKQHYQVTGYGKDGIGDLNDIFRISVPGAAQRDPVMTVRTVFRLIHHNTRCAVQSHSKQLPKWGWEQMEVTCNPNVWDKHSLWNVETVVDQRLPNASFDVYAPSFLEKLLESHAVMTQGNKGLKPKDGEVTSKPWQWPLNYKGQPFSGGDYRVYLLGNPIIWWMNLAALCFYGLFAPCVAVKQQRAKAKTQETNVKYNQESSMRPSWCVVISCAWLMLGWGFHYLPFWTMTRVLYFHHYFPAFLYSSILSGIFIDFVADRISRVFHTLQSWTIYHSILGSVVAALAYSFFTFSPFSYGMNGPSAQQPGSSYAHLKLLSSWDI